MRAKQALFLTLLVCFGISNAADEEVGCGGDYSLPIVDNSGRLVEWVSDSMIIEPVLGEYRVLVLWCRFESQGPDEFVEYAAHGNSFKYPDSITMVMAETLIFDDRYPAPPRTPNFITDNPNDWENYSGISLNDYLRYVSNDRFRITGEMAGPFILEEMDSTQWAYEIFAQALDSAVSAGYNIEFTADPVPQITGGDWDRVIIINPQYHECANCVMGGVRLGRIAWTNGVMRLFGITIHEFLHTLEVKHSNAWNCELNSTWPEPSNPFCGLRINGDRYDPMSGGQGDLNPRVKEKLDWFDKSQVKTITTSGDYILSPIHGPDGLKVLRIPRDSAYYYFHFREPIDYDSLVVLDFFEYTRVDGLFGMRVGPHDNPSFDNLLLDMPPLTSTVNTNLNRVNALLLETSYTDSVIGVSVRPIIHTGHGLGAQMTINVTIEDFGDYDGDGFTNNADNCLAEDNPGQEDTDNDGVGDACCCVEIRGDANDDGTDANILDLNYLVNFIFRGGFGYNCPNEANVNGDGFSGNIVDLNYCVNRIFRGGPPPANCP